MNLMDLSVRASALAVVALMGAPSVPQQTTAPFEPRVGQPGKDVVWVPTPHSLVETMLDMAQVTRNDSLMDLGSGDGVTVIAAAKRGVKAHGIEYNPDMVELSTKNAAAAGVTALATFEKADLFETDLSKATVITMFLLPAINMKLRPTLLDLRPGTRIVSNTFTMEDWAPDEKKTIPSCERWCTALLWIVPAKVAGAWRLGRDTLTLAQQFQAVSGTLGETSIGNTALRGTDIAFTAGSLRYTGRVTGDWMAGTSVENGRTVEWSATRQ